MIRRATPADADALSALARECFTQTFEYLYAPGDLAIFLDQAYSPLSYAPNFKIRSARPGSSSRTQSVARHHRTRPPAPPAISFPPPAPPFIPQASTPASPIPGRKPRPRSPTDSSAT